MVFSLILLAPSWGGMINGLMTLSGAWHKLRTDPILKFMVVALSFYGIATFEGPMMSIKTVNSLSHYTDWTVGHVHAGALGWVAMITVGCIYSLLPRLYGRKEMYSVRAIDWHFWSTTLGVVLYIASMWIAGVMQGLMWRATNDDGSLTYSFIEALNATYPYYAVRLLGGTMVLAGMFAYGQEHERAAGATRSEREPQRQHEHRADERAIGTATPCAHIGKRILGGMAKRLEPWKFEEAAIAFDRVDEAENGIETRAVVRLGFPGDDLATQRFEHFPAFRCEIGNQIVHRRLGPPNRCSETLMPVRS
jgi:heme/copper-type cytochrome/quinol oxidase subunit 1